MAHRLRLRGRSLRFQLVLLVLALLSISFIAVGGVTAIALRHFLVDRLDQQLVAAGDRFSLSLEHPDDHDADDDDSQFNSVEGQAAGTLGARVLKGTVTAAGIVASHDQDNHASVSDADKRVLVALPVSTHPRTVRLPGLGDYRMTVMAGDDGDLLLTGLPEHPVDETIDRLLLIEISVFAAALIVVGAAATVSVRLSLRPLHRVADTARAVSLLPLSTGTGSLPERAAVTAPHTEAGQVADAFNHMLEHIEAALRDRHASEDRLRQFIADASHELRTPVAVVRSHAEYAQRAGGELPDAVTEALTRITSESDRMGHLVEDLLTLARLDSGRPLEHEPVDVTRLVLDAVSDARVRSPSHHWRLELPEDELFVDGDPRALHQVAANLLANAAAHTPSATTVTATVSSGPETVVFSVHDDGPGVPEDVASRIFDRFVRADSARAHSEGSGLGLSIVAAIVEVHRGTVSVDSRPGSTTFTVSLPRRP
jgi:two-component system OmpR family sensor kinase